MTKYNNDYINDEDISILMEQGNISRDKAKELLKKYLGDIVECLININNVNKKKDIKKEDDEISPISLEKDNIDKYRNIIMEKETLYSYISEEKEKKKQLEKERYKLISENKPHAHLDTPKLNNEDLYYLKIKGNFTSIKIL